MKKMFTPLVLCLLLSYSGFSQIVWTFNDSIGKPTSNSYADIVADSMTTHNNLGNVASPINKPSVSSASSGYAGASGTFNIGVAARIGGLTDSSAYFEFTLTPINNASVILTALSFGTRSTGTGPQAFSVRTSEDAFTADIATGLITNNSAWQLIEKGDLNLTALAGVPVTVRIYGFNGTGSPGNGQINWRLDDVTVNGAILPVLLTNFTSSVVNSKVLLNWNTANETNLKGFAVERSSDAKNFSQVSFVAAGGTGKYSAQDALQSGISYYRLKTVNSDGSFSYSKNVVINTAAISASALHVYPNPVSSSAVVSHPQAVNGATLKITDLNGRVLQTYTLQTGAVQTTINAGKLLSGTYLLVYRDENGKTLVTRIIKN